MRAALFGKLPAHGDFVARGMEPEAVDRWDALASDGLEAARDALGAAFEDAHGAAPPWRFVARESGSENWRAGVLAPSMDGAGRRFCLLIAAEGLSAAEAAGLGPMLAEQFEALLYDALGQTLSADQVQDRAAQMVATAALSAPAVDVLGPEASTSVWWTLGAEAHDADLTAQDAPTPALFVRMLTPAGVLRQEAVA